MLKLKTPWTAARQAPLSLGLSRQEYWNGLPCPSPGDIPNPRMKPIPSMPPALPGELLCQSVQLSSVNSHPTLCDPINRACQTSLPTTNSRSLPKLMSIELVMPSNHLILCHPLLLLPPIFPSIRVFSNESALRIRWPKYWSFSFISPSNEHPVLISFKIYWLDLLAVQGTLKSLLQHHSSKASIWGPARRP